MQLRGERLDGARGRDEVINDHDEVETGHEELYLVVDGRRMFTVDGEAIDAPGVRKALVKPW